ncbi:MAG TPA: glucose-6-phosphate dehydrogenase assembly protein OpcA [Chthoniobacteraceae bacterium]|jgi:glucose-6-phosphate dehydrogenase assembly protein OpcA
MELDTSKLGQPVEVGQIGRELKKLWEASGGATTRASLINFAIYCEGADAGERNTELINEFTRSHACRALLIIAEPSAPETKIGAWINAHCHLSRAGAKQVCCEQISFVLEGRASNLIPNIVFSNLDSDLPLILWWQGEFPQPIDEQLWAWVDRLVFDSQKWSNPAEQFTRLLDSLEKIQSRLALCDLNWTRSLHLRQALAQMFDHPENRSILERLTVVKISYAADFRLTALLLVGWFAAQLRLEFVRHEGEQIFLRKSGGSEVSFHLTEEEGRSISRCYACSGDAAVEVTRVGNGDFFHVEVQLPEGRIFRHLLPAGSNQSPSLLAEELALGGRHRVYLKALAVAKALL